MSVKYKEFKGLHLPTIEKEILDQWTDTNAFEKSVELREGAEPFVFYEGPPSANGMPGIHHVISRTLKDLVCRYKTMQGYQVNRIRQQRIRDKKIIIPGSFNFLVFIVAPFTILSNNVSIPVHIIGALDRDSQTVMGMVFLIKAAFNNDPYPPIVRC